MLEGLDVFKLLNYGTGTAIAIVLVFFVVKVLLSLVGNLMENQKEIVERQSGMMQEMSDTLKDVAGALFVIQDNIKDLQDGQDHLWSEVKDLRRGANKDENNS